jgi:lipopolysaccharide transport system ATP-binding protein
MAKQHEVPIRLEGVGKAYRMYDRPQDRLKQMLWGRLGKGYGHEFWAVKNVDLELRRGETVGVIGRNGAGKSTLLQLICGTTTPTAGRIAVDGRVAAMLQLGAGFNPEFTGEENVRLSASVLGLSAKEIEARLPAILAFAGIGDFAQQAVKLYSSGMYARLAFAVSIHVDADILIVDEILSVGDAAFTGKCARFFERFKAAGGTLLFVSHSTDAVLALCDRAVWLDGGTVRLSGPARDVCLAYLGASGGDPPDAPVSPTRDDARLAASPVDAPVGEAAFPCEITVAPFDAEAQWYGYGQASITDVYFTDLSGRRLSRMAAGGIVRLHLRCETDADLQRVLAGWQLRDSLGQAILGDNTHLRYQHRAVAAAAGQSLDIWFELEVPYLKAGEYSLTVALADGTQADHEIQHWIDDAVALVVQTPRPIRGLIYVPMRRAAVEMH